jgi:hypothetical protein
MARSSASDGARNLGWLDFSSSGQIYGHIKTTIELPDALFHRAKVLAAQRKTTLKQLMVEGLEHVTAATTRQPAELTEDEKQFLEIDPYGIPVLKKRDVVVTNEMVNQMREEPGI